MVIKMAKMVQVSDEIYKTLMLHKGLLMVDRKTSVTFDDVIAHEVNKANGLGQVLSQLVRSNPELAEKIKTIAVEQENYEYVRGIVEKVKP
jgi:predicted CopG family antitoxin